MAAQSTSDDAIVVVSNQAPASLNIVRSLGRRGVRTIAAANREGTPAIASRYCDESVRLPDPFEDIVAYRDALLELAERPAVRTIAPVREPDVYVLSKYRDEFAEHVSTLWPDAETLAQAHDRVALVDAAETAGVAAPDTELLTDVEDWSGRRIVKARYGFLADRYVEDLGPENAIEAGTTEYIEPDERPDVDALVDQMGHVPIVQEYVDGTEYTIRALYDEGEPVVSTQKALRRGMKYPRGPSVYHEAVDIPELERAGLAILDELDWHGPASVGFIRDSETGTFKLLEINPRFWASLPCDIHAGVDYPHYYWQLANGATGPFDPAYRPGTASHFLRGELVHLHSVLTEEYAFVPRPSVGETVSGMAGSLLEQPNFDVFSLDDPRPFLRDTLNTVLGL
ncbi:ATP-grasp domain-containing protein [Haloarcula salinisoli]|uniref:ATP-grasp domain-containing protein n=1 Tax=Haloarcula salinisoli TaxID=2487746 RepID=A0A8J8C789_9EURY|nr:ATP-grasp domain-containing protein [Halomicroarcula salinisoli]MBX0285435.1 ATP-grasp domain-containing protein [Halomicroarcula salinisoli]MBX0303086.1 ATP-grasp domain-containing protein [Halomicroarcula salinisoli]